jgi:glyoxylase-like metal-dependent hydrolase (beta-lactamase superfamily II)
MNRYISQLKEAVGQSSDRKGPAADRVRREARELYERVTKLTADNFAPTQAIDGPHEIDLGGVKAVLRHLGAGHTDNDLVVHLPERNVLHAGDLLFHKRHPFVDRDGGADTRGWQAAARAAIELCDDRTIVVPGHGPITTVSALRAQVEYFDTAREIVREAVRAGKSRKDVAEMKPQAFAGLEGSPAMTLAAIFDEEHEPVKGG